MSGLFGSHYMANTITLPFKTYLICYLLWMLYMILDFWKHWVKVILRIVEWSFYPRQLLSFSPTSASLRDRLTSLRSPKQALWLQQMTVRPPYSPPPPPSAMTKSTVTISATIWKSPLLVGCWFPSDILIHRAREILYDLYHIGHYLIQNPPWFSFP